MDIAGVDETILIVGGFGISQPLDPDLCARILSLIRLDSARSAGSCRQPRL